jgi:hypothetical protein
MRSAVAAVASVLLACTGAVSSVGGRALPQTAVLSPPPARVAVDTLLGRLPDEGLVIVRLSVARRHPLGARLEPFILAWPGWSATLSSITSQPLAELEWIEVVGPKDPTRERLMTRTTIADDLIDARLRARSDGSLRVVARAQPHLVAALPPDGAPALVETLGVARVLEPDDPDPDQALYVDLPHPHGAMLYVPQETRRAVVRVDSRPGGAAEAFADLTFDDDDAASRMATRLQARAEEMNNLMVRVLTRDLLGALSITVEGAVVKLRLPATSEQLESLALLASAMLPDAPARLPTPSPTH